MPWKEGPALELSAPLFPSFLSNSLASDGEGRFAFIHGDRVQCTKKLPSCPNRFDFTLAYCESQNVSAVFWWAGVPRYNRPLLVFTTESSETQPATLQIWNAGRGTGYRLFRTELSALIVDDRKSPTDDNCRGQITFARALGQASTSSSGQLLFLGADTGVVIGVTYKQGKESGFRKACVLSDLRHPITAVSGDKTGSELLCASDEQGNLIVWKVEVELDRDKHHSEDYRSAIVYQYTLEKDFVCSLGIRNNFVLAGHFSGRLTFHDVDQRYLFASAVTNTRAITCTDIYREKSIALVGGEDCRVSVIGFSESRGCKPVVHFSIALDTIVIGCAFRKTAAGYPAFLVLGWELGSLTQFEYQPSENRQKKRAPGTPSSVGRTPFGFELMSPTSLGQELLSERSGESLLLPPFNGDRHKAEPTADMDTELPYPDGFSNGTRSARSLP